MQPISNRAKATFKIISTTMRITDNYQSAGLPLQGTGFLFDFSGCGIPQQTVLVTNRHCLLDGHGALRKRIAIDYAMIVDGERRRDCYEFKPDKNIIRRMTLSAHSGEAAGSAGADTRNVRIINRPQYGESQRKEPPWTKSTRATSKK